MQLMSEGVYGCGEAWAACCDARVCARCASGLLRVRVMKRSSTVSLQKVTEGVSERKRRGQKGGGWRRWVGDQTTIDGAAAAVRAVLRI